MPKLHLKRTPAEEAERAQRKARKAARKEARRRERYELEEDDSDVDEHHSKRHKGGRYEYPEEDLDGQSSTYHSKPMNDDTLQWREEDERFRQRMWDELGDQERLDNLETNLNSYSHIPHRWRSSDNGEPEAKANPEMMEEEEYAEWIRQGMWRKQHGGLYQEQLRRKAVEEARKTRERELVAEIARLEAAATQERQRKKRERDRSRWHDAKDLYETQWKALLAGEGDKDSLLFRDIPWPCIAAYGKASSSFSIEDLTEESISAFLLKSAQSADTDKLRRDKLRETLLRFHPDKFEGRVMSRVKFVDREKVQEAVGIVVRILNQLSNSK